MKKNPPLTMKDYLRVHRIARAVQTCRGEKVTKSCFFFSMVGSLILNRHFKRDARPAAGICSFRWGKEKNDVMNFGQWSPGKVVAHPGAFHAWVECGDYLIDFIAPIFGLAQDVNGVTFDVPRKMFQKHRDTMTSSAFELQVPGDFWMREDPALTQFFVEAYTRPKMLKDWIDVCCGWFERHPKKMKESLEVRDMQGKLMIPSLDSESLIGQW